jgi:hypothetical protein
MDKLKPFFYWSNWFCWSVVTIEMVAPFLGISQAFLRGQSQSRVEVMNHDLNLQLQTPVRVSE